MNETCTATPPSASQDPERCQLDVFGHHVDDRVFILPPGGPVEPVAGRRRDPQSHVVATEDLHEEDLWAPRMPIVGHDEEVVPPPCAGHLAHALPIRERAFSVITRR